MRAGLRACVPTVVGACSQPSQDWFDSWHAVLSVGEGQFRQWPPGVVQLALPTVASLTLCECVRPGVRVLVFSSPLFAGVEARLLGYNVFVYARGYSHGKFRSG